MEGMEGKCGMGLQGTGEVCMLGRLTSGQDQTYKISSVGAAQVASGCETGLK